VPSQPKFQLHYRKNAISLFLEKGENLQPTRNRKIRKERVFLFNFAVLMGAPVSLCFFFVCCLGAVRKRRSIRTAFRLLFLAIFLIVLLLQEKVGLWNLKQKGGKGVWRG